MRWNWIANLQLGVVSKSRHQGGDGTHISLTALHFAFNRNESKIINNLLLIDQGINIDHLQRCISVLNLPKFDASGFDSLFFNSFQLDWWFKTRFWHVSDTILKRDPISGPNQLKRRCQCVEKKNIPIARLIINYKSINIKCYLIINSDHFFGQSIIIDYSVATLPFPSLWSEKIA